MALRYRIYGANQKSLRINFPAAMFPDSKASMQHAAIRESEGALAPRSAHALANIYPQR
jgi:hypothetical protein